MGNSANVTTDDLPPVFPRGVVSPRRVIHKVDIGSQCMRAITLAGERDTAASAVAPPDSPQRAQNVHTAAPVAATTPPATVHEQGRWLNALLAGRPLSAAHRRFRRCLPWASHTKGARSNRRRLGRHRSAVGGNIRGTFTRSLFSFPEVFLIIRSANYQITQLPSLEVLHAPYASH